MLTETSVYVTRKVSRQFEYSDNLGLYLFLTIIVLARVAIPRPLSTLFAKHMWILSLKQCSFSFVVNWCLLLSPSISCLSKS